MRELMQVSMTRALLLVLVACAADKPVPSCQQAFDHYYGANCRLVNATTRQEIPEATVVMQCVTLSSAAPRNCLDELHDWLRCHNEVPSPAMTDEQCNCSPELTTLLACQ